MPTITQLSDFVGEIVIANATTPTGAGQTGSGVGTNLTWFINQYEPEFLNELFGTSFAALFVAGIAADPVDARWTAILNIPGFKLAIDRYIYYWYMRDQAEQTVGIGVGRPKSTNMVNVSGKDKVVKAWYKMYRVCWQVLRFLQCNATTYPEYCLPRWYYPFSVIWGNAQWNWSLDIFYSNIWYAWYINYNIPSIFIPLSRL